MVALRDIIITGLLLGGIFALVSVGLSLQYGVGRVLNVAHGEFIMIGAFVTFWLCGQPSTSTRWCPSWSPRPSIFVIGWLLHATLFRRLMHNAPSLDVFEGTVDAGLVRAALRRAEHSPDHLGLSDLPGHLPEHAPSPAPRSR